MPQFTLQQLATITQGILHGSGERIIDTLETDSRNIHISDSCLFIAIRGPRHDGHDHLNELLAKGIRNFLVERETPELKRSTDSNYILVDHCLTALQQIAANYRSALKMPLIAITGSNGKTVVKEWLAQCLARKSAVSRSPKSYNSQIGVPLSVWLLQPEADWALIEAGISMPGEMERLERILSPDMGIITNIGPAHQENFTSMEQKTREKLLLFRQARQVYYCRDHRLIHQMISEAPKPYETITWSMETDESYLYVAELKKETERSRVKVSYTGRDARFSLPFTDEASLENGLHIITFLLHQRYSPEEVQACLDELRPLAMRLEQISGIRNCTLINDSYNSDLHSLRIALDYLALQKQHQKHALILSDIQQSGLPSEKLYGEVFSMLKSYPINRLIVVGKEITKSGELPESALSYTSTEDLLRDLSSIDLADMTLLIKGARQYGFERIVHALSQKKHTTVLEINLDNLVHNLNYFRGLLKSETKIMVMVKALSYGSGSYEIANLLQHQKVDYLGVAFTDEGVELRKAGIGLPIMVMAASEESFDEVIEYDLEPEIFSLEGLKAFSETVARKQLQSYPVHIKLDTGMHRLGFMPDEIGELSRALMSCKNIRVKALFSHLAVSDNPDEDSFTRQQIQVFKENVDFLSSILAYKPLRHMLNSAGIERFPEAHFDMVRLGIGLHGISGTTDQLKTVSTLKTRISQIKRIPATDTVGYNRHGVLDRDSDIAILPIGYADGLDRKLGNRNGQVILNGNQVPFIGDICMDLSMIDITGLKASVGDEVIIFGKDHTIAQLARQVDTIPYEILTNVSARVKRIYINE